ncbi:efflux RND transporter permease subunit [Halothiobacillus sp. DCM-1]|uniref:efflux RND transporter permease subunit n=1 Tax=Halothiobacillus sp. DCM-1 TaxID=3112558 RepID=UPI0032457848
MNRRVSAFNLSALAVRERAVTLYFILMVALVGVYAFVSLGRAEDPSFTIKVMVVTAQWPGATARQMQDQVADPLEKALQAVPYFDRVETTARPGSVEMLINFKESTPPDQVQGAFYQVRKHLGDVAHTLPPGVLGPFFNDDFSDVYFTLYALTAPGLPDRELTRQAERLRQAVLRVPGVAKAHIIGERPEQVMADLDPVKLQGLNLSVAQIAQALAAQNAVTPAGLIETAGPRVYLRIDGGYQADEPGLLARIAATPLVIGDRQIRLGDVATLRHGEADPPSFLIQNRGQDAVMVGVIMAANVNGLSLGQRLDAFERAEQANLPLGVQLTKVTDQAHAIAAAVNTFQIKFFVALGVVMLVGFLALGLRAGLVVALAVPLTLSITFAVMWMTGKNLDRITLGALILSLGLLVDDAIIAIEMMLVKLEEGLPREAAAAAAWDITAAPMLVGTLITVTGFVPIGFAVSNVGEYAGNIFWVLGISLIASWFVAVVFTPYLGVKLLPHIPAHPQAEAGMYQGRLYRGLRRVVVFCVDYRWLVAGATLLLFVAAVGVMKQGVAKQFFPSSDRPELLIDIELPEGSSIRATEQVAHRVEAVLNGAPQLESLSTYIGQGAPRFFLALNPELPDPAFAKIIAVAHNAKQRDELQAFLQRKIDEGAFPEARVRPHPLLYGPPVIWPVQFRVMGPQIRELRRIGESVRAVMAQNPHTIDPHLAWGEQTPVWQVKLDPARLAALALTPAAVAEQTQGWLNGQTATPLRVDIRSVALVLRGAPDAVRDPQQLAALPIRLGNGRTVPLGQIGAVTTALEYPVLKRRNREPYINVNAEVQGAQPPDVTNAIWQALASVRANLPPGYEIQIGGSVEESGKAQASILKVMPVMLVLMLTLLMLMMRSFPGLFMVLLTAPLGLIGAASSLALFQQPFGFVALLGLIGLAGILMRNTLILVGQIHENERQGQDRYTAVIEATIRRARPVVLTALAAVLAFIPLTESTFWGPLAYTLIGGIFVGTFLTILFLPAMYALWFRVRRPTG